MFHSLGAEQENDPSYIVVRDVGTYNDPLSVDRKFRACTCDTGFSKVDMYSGVRAFNALHHQLILVLRTRFVHLPSRQESIRIVIESSHIVGPNMYANAFLRIRIRSLSVIQESVKTHFECKLWDFAGVRKDFLIFL